MSAVTVTKILKPRKYYNVRWISKSVKREQELLEPSLAETEEWSLAKPYSEVPGPRPLPLIGNTWRLLPIIGQYQVSDLGKVSQLLYERYGKVRYFKFFFKS